MDILTIGVCILSIIFAAINLNLSALVGWSFVLGLFLRCRKLEKIVNDIRISSLSYTDADIQKASNELGQLINEIKRKETKQTQFYEDSDWWKK
jgi:hypothetical protein